MNATDIHNSTSGFKVIYITRIACSFGVILNVLGLKIMLIPRLIHRLYNFIWSTKYYLMLLKDISLLLLFSSHAFDILVYLIMDPNLRMSTREFFCVPIPAGTTVSFLKFNIKFIKIRL